MLRFDPPTVVIEYTLNTKQPQHLKITARKLHPRDRDDFLRIVLAKCSSVLRKDKISQTQIERLVDKLMGSLKGASVLEQPRKATSRVGMLPSVHGNGGNTKSFSSMRKKLPSAPAPSTSKKQSAEDFDSLLDELLGDEEPAEEEINSKAKETPPVRSAASSVPERSDPPAQKADPEDYNKLSKFELRLVKEDMDKEFHRKQIKPGDPGYVFDKKVDFGEADEDASWDESDSD